MGSYLWSVLRAVPLAVVLLFLLPFVMALLLFSALLKKDEAHISGKDADWKVPRLDRRTI